MTTRNAATNKSVLSMTGIAALLLFGTALASTDSVAPCPDLVSHTETTLLEDLDNEIATSEIIRTVETSAEQDDTGNADEVVISNTETRDIATRLPGVSASDMPRFRRHMFRTDI